MKDLDMTEKSEVLKPTPREALLKALAQEPTAEMIAAGLQSYIDSMGDLTAVYEAMWDAAPTAPLPAEDVAGFVAPRDAEHLPGCEHTTAPFWLCDCPRPKLAAPARLSAGSEVVVEWSLSFYGSPPGVTVWSGKPGFADSRREIGHARLPNRETRTAVGSMLSALVDIHNETVRQSSPLPASADLEAATFAETLRAYPDSIADIAGKLTAAQREDILQADKDDAYCPHFGRLYYDDLTFPLVDAYPAHHDPDCSVDDDGGTRWSFTALGLAVHHLLKEGR
jgi:hypothetical protein